MKQKKIIHEIWFENTLGCVRDCGSGGGSKCFSLRNASK